MTLVGQRREAVADPAGGAGSLSECRLDASRRRADRRQQGNRSRRSVTLQLMRLAPSPGTSHWRDPLRRVRFHPASPRGSVVPGSRGCERPSLSGSSACAQRAGSRSKCRHDGSRRRTDRRPQGNRSRRSVTLQPLRLPLRRGRCTGGTRSVGSGFILPHRAGALSRGSAGASAHP